MRNLFLILSTFVLLFHSNTSTLVAQVNDTVKDGQAHKIYKTVKLGEQIWMAENLDYETPNSYCYNNNTENCTDYGRLYNWDDAKHVCPKGWHLPSLKEWQQLISYLGGEFTAGIKLISGGDSGFNALMGGLRSSDGKYSKFHDLGLFWTSTEFEDMKDVAWMYVIRLNGFEVYSSNTIKSEAFSVRCIKDSE